MRKNSVKPKIFVVLLMASLPACSLAQTRGSPAGVVDKVWSVEVVHDGPIAVEVALAQEHVIAWENFLVTVRIRNLTTRSLELRGLSPESTFAYTWVSVHGGTFTEFMRIHPGDVHVPSGGRSITALEPNETIEYTLFFMRDERVVALSRDWLIDGLPRVDEFDLSLVVCPVFVLVNGKQETLIAVESNMLNVKLRRPTRREGKALRYLIDLEQLRGEESIPYRERYRLFLEHYPDVPYAARVRYDLVRTARLHKYKAGTPPLPSAVLESIEFCLDRGSPFADAVLTNASFEFFLMTERWHLAERVAQLLAETPEYDRRFHNTHGYVGAALVKLDSNESLCNDPVWRRRLQPVLLKCLKRALTRSDEDAERLAPRVLSLLERLEEWELLERAAELALDDPRTHDKATRALRVARERIGNK